MAHSNIKTECQICGRLSNLKGFRRTLVNKEMLLVCYWCYRQHIKIVGGVREEYSLEECEDKIYTIKTQGSKIGVVNFPTSARVMVGKPFKISFILEEGKEKTDLMRKYEDKPMEIKVSYVKTDGRLELYKHFRRILVGERFKISFLHNPSKDKSEIVERGLIKNKTK